MFNRYLIVISFEFIPIERMRIQNKIYGRSIRKKSLTTGPFLPTKLVSFEWQRCVAVAEHKTSHIRGLETRSISPLQLHQEVRNFAQRKLGRTFYATRFTPRFAGPRRAGSSSPPLFLSFLFTLCMRTFTGRGGCAQQTFPLISWSRTRGANFRLSVRERENVGRGKAEITAAELTAGELHIRSYSRNPPGSIPLPEFQMSDALRVRGYSH